MIVQDTRVSVDPVTKAVNCCIASGASVTACGDNSTEIVLTETKAVADRPGSARLLAVTLNVPGAFGAV